jgi:hypothetical protein
LHSRVRSDEYHLLVLLFSYYALFDILFIYLLVLGAEDFKNLQELDVQDFEQQLVGEQGN